MKHIITKAYSGGDWFIKDFAIIRVNDSFKETVRKALDYINSAPTEFNDKTNITIYNIPFLNFYDSGLLDDLDDDELCPDVQQVLMAKSFNDFQEDDYIDILNPDNLSCIEGEVKAYDIRCEVSSDGVQFKANNKYGDMEEMWTDDISFETILNF